VATTQSGVALGSSTLIDGYANGWYVPGAVATGTTVVNIEWQPQRVVNAAILASSGALAASLGLVLIPPGLVAGRLARRRGRKGKGDHAAAEPDMQPRLSNPFRSGGLGPAWYWAAGIAVLGGLVAAAIVAPLAGLAIGALLLLGLLVDRSRVVLVLGALGLITLTGVVMARGQFIHRFVPDINWPAHFPVANSLTWLAICLLAVDAIVVAVRLRSDEDSRPAEPEAADEGASAQDSHDGGV
jgi:hypothetical protein